jgi:hypothetical protein
MDPPGVAEGSEQECRQNGKNANQPIHVYRHENRFPGTGRVLLKVIFGRR